MKDKILFKSFSFKANDVESNGTIRGYASTFGNIDLGMDVVDKGAFKKSIKESGGGKIPILKDHNQFKLIGFNMRAEEDDTGLYVEGKINLDVQDGREQYSLAKQALDLGVSFGLSIGYMTIKAEPDRQNPMIRHLKELKLFEYSLVTFPMNTEAMITDAKGLVGVDRASHVIEQLKKQGMTEADLVQALHKGAAAPSEDPKKALQSLDALITLMKA